MGPRGKTLQESVHDPPNPGERGAESPPATETGRLSALFQKCAHIMARSGVLKPDTSRPTVRKAHQNKCCITGTISARLPDPPDSSDFAGIRDALIPAAATVIRIEGMLFLKTSESKACPNDVTCARVIVKHSGTAGSSVKDRPSSDNPAGCFIAIGTTWAALVGHPPFLQTQSPSGRHRFVKLPV